MGFLEERSALIMGAAVGDCGEAQADASMVTACRSVVVQESGAASGQSCDSARRTRRRARDGKEGDPCPRVIQFSNSIPMRANA